MRRYTVKIVNWILSFPVPIGRKIRKVLQRSRVGERLTLVFGQLHLVCGKRPAAVRITVHLNNGWLQAEVVADLRRGIWLTRANQTLKISSDYDRIRLDPLTSNMPQIQSKLTITIHCPSFPMLVKVRVQYYLTFWYLSNCLKTSMADQGRVACILQLHHSQ